MSFRSPLDVSTVGFLLVTGALSALLLLSAWLDSTPRRLAPNALVVSGIGLVAVTIAALLRAPILLLLAILLAWAVALVGYELGWVCVERWQRRTPRTH